MRTPTQARLRILRDLVRDYQGDIKTGMVQKHYVSKLGPGDWRGKARQDLDQLAREGLLIRDDRNPDARVFRLNHAHQGGA
ncbi:hypothetical protein GTX53_24185 [Streptomyces sp. SID5594]|uniref:hypothetical protein n=1 Tax=unclassified Streptomyces TaxID=2593676 RepID=UPI0003728591|nr:MULTISPECIES: hypothetical protein [unclassified Streptomyces]MZF56891.1 hypothetical protein [Streptomyces sp. SID5594]